MIDVNELRAYMARNGMTQGQVAKSMGISEPTFGRKLKNGKFYIDEVNKMISILKINNPSTIFFTSDGAYSVPNKMQN